MGIIFPGDLGPDRLLAKVLVPPTEEWILESVVGTNLGWADNDEVLAQIVRLIKQEIQL